MNCVYVACLSAYSLRALIQTLSHMIGSLSLSHQWFPSFDTNEDITLIIKCHGRDCFPDRPHGKNKNCMTGAEKVKRRNEVQTEGVRSQMRTRISAKCQASNVKRDRHQRQAKHILLIMVQHQT